MVQREEYISQRKKTPSSLPSVAYHLAGSPPAAKVSKLFKKLQEIVSLIILIRIMGRGKLFRNLSISHSFQYVFA